MWLRKAANLIERGLSPLTVVVGKIGSCVIIVMMLITVSDVVGRRLFGQAILGVYELSQLTLVIVTFLTFGYVEVLRRHITIGLVVSRLRQRAQDVIDSITYVFFLVIFCLLTWQLGLYAVDEQRVHSVISTTLEVPVFPFVFVAAFGCALLSLVVLIHLLLFLAGAAKK